MAENLIRRVPDVQLPTNVYRTICIRCERPIELWYNGGELDYRDCCGLTYRLEAPKIDFTITERVAAG